MVRSREKMIVKRPWENLFNDSTQLKVILIRIRGGLGCDGFPNQIRRHLLVGKLFTMI
jgi:hypothetical protein